MPPKLGILAGKGELPRRLIEACHAEGREVFVIAFPGETDRAVAESVSHAWLPIAQVGGILRALHEAQVEEVVLAGAIRRPSFLSLKPDRRGLSLLGKITRGRMGDDGILSLAVAELESEGFRVVGLDELLPDTLAPEGPLGRLNPDDSADSDISRGFEVAVALGRVDVGQAVVVQHGAVLGVEAIEGTDALIARCADLKRDGPGGILVKVSKPGQEQRVDLPTIGVRTVTAAAAAGLRGIAIEAGATVVVGRQAVAKAADQAGLFVVGVRFPR